MNPEDFLGTAAMLAAATHESDHRSAVSRAYYAVYHMLRIAIFQTLPLSLLQSSGIGSKHQISHDRLPLALKSTSDPAIAKIGEHLQLLKMERSRADYRLDSPLSQASALANYTVALKLRDELKAFGLQKLVLALKSDLEKTYGTAP